MPRDKQQDDDNVLVKKRDLKRFISPDLTQLETKLMTSIADLKAAVAANVEATKVMKARFETDIAALKAQLDAINAELAGVTDDVKADTADELGGAGPSGSIPE
jgi:chromosome segregation ATPase